MLKVNIVRHFFVVFTRFAVFQELLTVKCAFTSAVKYKLKSLFALIIL